MRLGAVCLLSPSRAGRKLLLVVADLTRLEMASRRRRNKPIFHAPSVVDDDRLLSWWLTRTSDHTRSSRRYSICRRLRQQHTTIADNRPLLFRPRPWAYLP